MSDDKVTVDNTLNKSNVRISGYISLVLAILFFSGIFKDVQGPLRAFDFSNLMGQFGTLGSLTEGSGTLAGSFRGAGGVGVKDGWLFALTLFPTVMFALGIVKMVESLDGLKAAEKLLTPLLKPLLGLPGIVGLALVASLQSTDGGASMTNELAEQGQITEKEKLKFVAFQFSCGATITNYLGSGAALFPFMDIPISIPFAIIFIYKIVGTNLMRLYVDKFIKEEI